MFVMFFPQFSIITQPAWSRVSIVMIGVCLSLCDSLTVCVFVDWVAQW